MKASSRPDANLPPFVGLPTERRDGALERGRVVAAHVQRIAERHGLLHAGIFRGVVRPDGPGRARAPTMSLGQRCAITSSTVPCVEQFAVGNISQPMATLGFVHVMRRDEKRQSLAGESMNLFPEIAARFWIDTRSRLVEQATVSGDE